MAVSLDMIQDLVRKWQDILRLRDWDIQVRIVDKEWRKSGDIKMDMDDKKAVMLSTTSQNPQISKNLLFMSCCI